MGDLLHFDFLNPATPPNDRVAYAASAQYLTLKPDDAPAELRFSGKRENGLVIEKIFRFYPDQYKIDLQIEAQNRSAAIRSGAFAANLRALPPKEKKSYYSYVGLVLLLDDELEEVELEDPGEEKNLAGRIQWMAYEDDYFLSAIVPRDSKRGNFVGRRLSSGALDGTYIPETVSLNPHEKTSARFALYLGPRDLGALKQMGQNLDRSVYFGWTNVIARPLLYLLRFFNQYLHNYGVSIILLTILVKILFWPLTHKSYKSMSKMKKLQPHMTKIKDKYKNNREQMNKEMMALYKTYKVNPMGGCLPMVIQIPVFFALFRILGSSIELRHAPFILWIDDLSAPDRLFNFPFEIPFMAAPYGIPVLTLLMGASMFLQQKMTPTPGDPAQAKIMMFLPIIFTFVFINFPAGLVLYWLVNNVLSIAQQYRIQKKST